MVITVKKGRVWCEPMPETMDEYREKIQACVRHCDKKGVVLTRKWLNRIYGSWINARIDEWIKGALYD